MVNLELKVTLMINFELANKLIIKAMVKFIAHIVEQNVQNCGKNDSQVQGCYSHCLDKTIEATVIQATVASNDLKVVVKQIPQLLNSTSPIVVISAQVDLSNVNGRVSYTYYDDLNFCSVFIKIKKPAMFPYAISITVQQVL
uniref:Uncharacterized protein n=1 Tax=Caenorhabditis japonica TaxID=281687 RepID=A0A8R1HNC2_CAEJA